MNRDGRIPVRLRVGIIGHRRLDDPERVAAAIRHVLEDICAQVAHDDRPVGLIVVSPLAEGVDRVGARVGLEFPGSQLEAILPFEPEEYEADFGSDTSRREFRELLNRSRWQVGSTDERPNAYRDAARAVVDCVDVVVAVQRTDASRDVGGTRETVAYSKKKHVPTVVIDAARPDEVRVPRVVSEADFFNRQRIRDRTFATRVDASRAMIASYGDGADPDIEPLADWIVPRFTRADMLAIRYQSLFYRLGLAVFMLAATAVSIGIAELIFARETSLWGWLVVACILAGIACVYLGNRRHVSDRWLAYRSLAERFRTAVFLARLGVAEHPTPPLERSGQEVAAEGWVLDAALDVWNQRPRVNVQETDLARLTALVADNWIAGQIAYHQRAEKQQRRRERAVRTATMVAVLWALAVAVVSAVDLVGNDTAQHWLTLLGFVVPLFAAAWNGVSQQREYGRHAERYERMVQNLRVVRARILDAVSLLELQKLALLADTAIREERGDWFGTMVFKHLEVAP